MSAGHGPPLVPQPVPNQSGVTDDRHHARFEHDALQCSYRSADGEGDFDAKAWGDAVKSTGFDGTWSSELLSPKHWEWDLREVAREARRLMVEYAS